MNDEALKKKREFWINPRAEQIVYSSSGAADKLFIAREKRYQYKEIHVIEYSAYAETKQLLEEVKAEKERLRLDNDHLQLLKQEYLAEVDKLKVKQLEILVELTEAKSQLLGVVNQNAELTAENEKLKQENYDITILGGCQRQSKINELDELKFNKDNCEKRNVELTTEVERLNFELSQTKLLFSAQLDMVNRIDKLTATLKLAEEALTEISYNSTVRGTSFFVGDVAKKALATIKERMGKS